MAQLVTRNLTKEDIELCKSMSLDSKFEKFKGIFSRDLDYFRELSDEDDGRESELMSKGARQYIKRLQEITDKAQASTVFDRMKE